MKNTFYTILSTMVILSLLTACGDDDSEDTTPVVPTEQNISFEGTSYTVEAALVTDYGAQEVLDTGGATHYNMVFTIGDDDFVEFTDTIDGNYFGASDNTTFICYVDLYSPGTSSFQTGTFTYVDDDTLTEAGSSGLFFMDGGEIELDNDGVERGDLDGPEFGVTGGSVSVQSLGSNEYEITYDLEFDGSINFTGSYNGTFTYDDQR